MLSDIMIKSLILVYSIVWFIHWVIVYKMDKTQEKQTSYFWDGFMIGMGFEFIILTIVYYFSSP